MQQLNVFEHEEEIERLLLQDFATIAKLETKKITFLCNLLNNLYRVKSDKQNKTREDKKGSEKCIYEFRFA
mgnify:CR=1 FL=1|jgi:hypothetical protein